MITRRALLKSSVGLLASSPIMAACTPKIEPTPSEQPQTGSTQKPAQKEAIELVFWSGIAGPDGELFQKIVNRYNDGPGKEAGVSVKHEAFDQGIHNTKAMASYAAGQPIDILWTDSGTTAAMVEREMLLPLDDLMTGAGLAWDDFYPSTVKVFTFGGKRYGIPTEVSNYTIFYNTEQAKAAGLDLNNFPKDRDGFVEWAKAVTKVKDGKIEVAGLVIPGTGALPYRWWFQGIYQNEGALLTEDFKKAAFNTEAGKEACQFVLDCWDTYKISDRNTGDARKAFNGKYGSIIQDGSWMAPSFAKTEGLSFNTAMLPVYGRKLAGFAITMARVALKHDPEKPGRAEAVAHFLKWLADDIEMIVEAPAVPVRNSMGQLDKVRQIPYFAPFIDMVAYGIEAPPIAKYSEISTRIIEILDTVWSKQTPVAEGLSKAETQVNAILAG